MAGNGPRRDAKDAGSAGAGMAAMLKKRADALYAAATLQHVRTGALDEAVMHMRDADEAEQEGRPIEEVREFRRLASEALRKTQAELQWAASPPKPWRRRPPESQPPRKSPAPPTRPPPLISKWSPTTTSPLPPRRNSELTWDLRKEIGLIGPDYAPCLSGLRHGPAALDRP